MFTRFVSPLLVLAIFLLFGSKAAEAQLIVWSSANGGNDHAYGLTPFGSWTSAEAYAVSQGGHLVTIDNAAENGFIKTNFISGAGASRDLWIGLESPTGDWTDPATWVWVSGSTSTYRNWRVGQPDGGFADGEDDRYAAINWPLTGDEHWDNYPNSVYRQPQGIFEVPEPASLALLIFGAGLVLPRSLSRKH